MIEPPTSTREQVRAVLAAVAASGLLLLAGPGAAHADWHQWTRAGFRAKRHPTETTAILRAARDLPDGGRVCAGYSNLGRERRGKIGLVVEVVRNAGTPGALQLERIDLGSRDLAEQPRINRVRFECRATGAIREGDTLLFRFKYKKIPPKTIYHEVEIQLEPPLSRRSSIELQSLTPGFGTTHFGQPDAQLELRYACREAPGCLVTVMFTGELIRQGTRFPFPEADPDLVVEVETSRGTLSLPISICHGSARASDGLLLRIERRNRELLNEQWIPGKYDCR